MRKHHLIVLPLLLAVAAKPQTPNEQLELHAEIKSERYCNVDDEISSLRVIFTTRLIAVGSSNLRCSEEVSTQALDQPRNGTVTVGAVSLGTKAVERSQCTLGRDFEDRATSVPGVAVGVSPALKCCPVEVPVGALNQPSKRRRAVSAIRYARKLVKHRHGATRGDLEDRALLCRPVEVPVEPLHKRPQIRVGTYPSGQWIKSCSILTTTPNAVTASVHDRMPVILGQSGQRICAGVEGGKLPERRHASRGAGDVGIQGEGAGHAGRSGLQDARRTG